MRWALFILFYLTFSPLQAISEDESLQEFDDDAFLSGKAETSSDGLIGWSLFRSDSGEDTYIINFNNVSIIEYIRFVSRISNINFQFEEEELNFPITVISEEPLTVPNIVSALIQTLRARGFKALEQGNSLLITTSREINQIPTIVTPESAKKNKGERAPIITRIFRIENANLASVAAIIRPMMSATAMVEISNETRQLIITDITTNVEKIATLLKTLDTPHSPLEIDVYKARHMPAKQLVEMTKEIVLPFAEESSIIMVAQTESNAIYIVSTPSLIERTMEILEDLDVQPGKGAVKGPIGNQVYLYQIVNKSADDLLDALEEIATELEGSDSESIALISALENAKYIKESNSLLFITNPDVLPKVEQIIKTLDIASEANNFYIYKIQKAGKEQIEKSLEQLARSLQKGDSDEDLVDTIHSMRYIKESNSLIFTGTDESLKKLQQILPTFDVAVAQYSPSSHYWLYTPQYLSGKELERAFEDLEDNLSTSGLSNQELLHTIQGMKWVPSTNTLLFTGTPQALDDVQSIVKLIDVPAGSPNKIFIYKPSYIDEEQIEDALDELADRLDHKNLSDRNLAKAIDTMTWIPESQAFLFKADPASIEKIEGFLKDIDNPKEAEVVANTYYLYKLKFAQGDDVIDYLESIAKNLPSKDPAQKAVINVIDKVSYLRESNSVLLTGSQKSVEEVKALIEQFDVKGATPPNYEKTSFFIYKPKYLTADVLEEALQETASDLRKSGLIDKSLLQAIDTMQVVELTGSVIFTGSDEALKKTKEIISTIDVEGTDINREKASQIEAELEEAKIREQQQRASTQELQALRQEIAKLRDSKNRSAAENQRLKQLEKEVEEKLDRQKQLAEKQKPKEEEVPKTNFFIYKVRYISLDEMLKHIENLIENLQSQNSTGNKALIKALQNAKELKDTKSIIFTGSSQVLEKINELVKLLDTPDGLGKAQEKTERSAEEYVIYKPTNVSGPQLIDMMQDFLKNLQNTGVNEPRLFETIQNLQYIEKTGYILISGPATSVEKAQELLKKFDLPGLGASGAVTSLSQLETSFLVYKLHYHKGIEIQEALKKIGSDLSQADPQTGSKILSAINSLQWIKMTNSLLATGSPDVLTQLKELIQNIDVPLRQVFIEVLIIKTTLSNNQQFGLQWGGKAQYLNRFAAGTSVFPSPQILGGSSNTALAQPLAEINASRTPQAADIIVPTGAGGFDLGVIGDIILHKGKSFISLASLVNALQQDTDSVVMMNPKIVAQDNQQATIFVGQNIPFTGSVVQTTGGGVSTAQSANIEYRDVGTNLSITPILGGNDTVTLDIVNEISRQVETSTTNTLGLTGLQTTRTSLNARVHVPNKHFVALSGMITEEKNRFKSALPCLGGLPVIGAIFSENDRFASRENIIFFIRPVIIDTIEQYDQITENQECLLKELGQKQIVKEEIDDAIDWVRRYDCN